MSDLDRARLRISLKNSDLNSRHTFPGLPPMMRFNFEDKILRGVLADNYSNYINPYNYN